ncbi:MAG: methylmalonyl-CoA epimerase [Bacteroidia bacterium]|nr:methylmalonyl-CoA epimerase [Bacteroidia bacterium]
MKLEHIGIAVADAQKSIPIFSALLNQDPYKTEVVDSEHVKTVFFQTQNCKIELLEATDEQSVIHNFITKRGEGLHHIAFEVPDILTAMEQLRAKGIRTLNEHPKAGADNKLICFLHPKDTNGVLIELCQEK